MLVGLLTSSGERFVSPHWDHTPSLALGLIGALLYCLSICFHEIGHLIALRHYRLEVESITLNASGGRTRAIGEIPGPMADAVVASGGPICTLLLAGLGFASLWAAGNLAAKEVAVTLAILNLCILPGCVAPI